MTDILLTIVITVIASSGFWTFVNNRLTERKRKDSAEIKGIKALLYTQINHECHKVLSQGYVTQEQYDDILFLFTPYEGLNGNGRAKKLWDEVQKLPLRPE